MSEPLSKFGLPRWLLILLILGAVTLAAWLVGIWMEQAAPMWGGWW